MSSSDDLNGDQLDEVGQSILRLLQKASEAVGRNSQDVRDMAQKLSHQLRAAQDRIAHLEAELAASQHRAERAEQWLDKIRSEIEEQFTDHWRSARQ